MARGRHSNKEIEAALQYAENRDWTIVESPRGHCWGVLRCPHGRGGCQKSIWSTPRNPQNHANAIRRFVDHCTH
jgi:hypothetical protein